MPESFDSPGFPAGGPFLGFDGSTHDDCVVVVRRNPDGDGWLVDSAGGGDPESVARAVAELFEQPVRPAPPASPLAEQVVEWLNAYHAGPGQEFELDDWQRDVLARMYENPIKDLTVACRTPRRWVSPRL